MLSTHLYLKKNQRYPLYLFILIPLFLAFANAQAQTFFADVDELYAEVIAQLSAGDIEAAEQVLEAIPVASRGGDYHYLRGVLAMESMNDAGTFRMARLARRMKGHFEDALQIEPDHALSHFGLMQFHRFAPALMGGRQRELEYHEQRLLELDSFLQFPAAVVKAQMEENRSDEEAAYEAWLKHSPDMYDAHYGYLSSLISWGEYERAHDAINEAFQYADDEQVQLINYQRVRMAALFAIEHHEQEATEKPLAARALELEALEWFTAAHASGVALLDKETLAAGMDETWLQIRVAQIEWGLQENDSALARLEIVRDSDTDDRLLAEVDTLAAKINAEGE